MDEAKEARDLAASILLGGTQPYGIGGIYAPKEWRQAAQYLIDSDDCSEMLYMIAQEDAALEQGDSWWTQADYDNDDTYAGEWR